MTQRETKLIELGVINTELTEGCRVNIHTVTGEMTEGGWDEDKGCSTEVITLIKEKEGFTEDLDYIDLDNYEYGDYEILGHPLYIGDVMQWNEIKFDSSLDLLIVYRGEDVSLPFHLLPEENQKAVCDILYYIS